MTTKAALDEIQVGSVALVSSIDYCRELSFAVDAILSEILVDLVPQMPLGFAHGRLRQVVASATVLLTLQRDVCAQADALQEKIELAADQLRRILQPVREAPRAVA